VFFCFFTTGLHSQSKTLGLTQKLNGNDENGYILFTPISTDTTFLLNKCGQRIHSWRSQYTPGLSVYLKPNGNLLKTGTYTDTVFGFAGGRGGIIEEFDWDNNLVWRYKIFNDSLCQHHDIKLLPNGNVLVLTWHSITKNKAMNLGRNSANFLSTQTDLWGERIIELKPIGKDSAEVVWQWDLFDHIVQDKDTTLPNYGVINMHPELLNINYALNLKTNDWIHANSLDYNEELDQIVISCHNISEIWIIDHSTTISESKTHLGGKFNKGGDFLYRWGNPEAYNMGTTKDRKLFRQHNAHWIPKGLKDSGSIMLFNNGWNRDTAYSTVEVIKTPILSNGSYISNLPYGPFKQSWIYKDSIPTRFYSQIISGAQRLPNGNTLICSGVQGRFFEVTPSGKTVWEYKNPIFPSGAQMDGQKPQNNQVFRCEYYPKSFAAFKNRTLNSTGPLEKSPYPYSCIYENIPPKIVSFSPKKNDTAIATNKILSLTLDEAVIKKEGNINIFQNGALLESISVHSDMVKINNKVVNIEHFKPFAVNAKIAVSMPANSFRDSSNNLLNQSIDTADWFFYTIKAAPKILTLSPAHQTLNVKADTKLEIVFSEPMIKASGNISIYENGTLKEAIPVGNNRVDLQGDKVIISPSVPFSANTLVIVSMDSCFIDSAGIKTSPVVYGNWYFRTLALPAMVALSPALNAFDVTTDQVLSVEFNRDLSTVNNNDIRIYANNVLFETIPVNDARVSISGKILSIDPLKTYGFASRISVMLPGNTLRDTFGLFFSGTDTSAWHFKTSAKSSIHQMPGKAWVNAYPNPNQGKFTLTTNQELTQLELFDFTGKRLHFVYHISADNQYEIESGEISPGHYVLLLNGVYSMVIQITE